MRPLLKCLLRKISPIFFWWLRRLRYETKVLPREFIDHVKKISRSSLVIDVGANIGRVSEVLAHRGARVISFEPNSNAFDQLKGVASRYSNIELRNEAAGVKNQQIKLFLHEDINNTDKDLTQPSSLISQKPNVSANNYELVNEIDFAQFLKSLDGKVELVKIDIEGYEIQLLNHLMNENAIDNVKKFYVETHEQKMVDLAIPTRELKERINREGYKNKFFFDWH